MGSSEEIAAAPNAFDFARSARAGGPAPRVAYWSAQLESLFERKDIRSSTDSFVTLPDLIGRPIDDEDSVIDQGVDRLLAARVERSCRRRRAALRDGALRWNARALFRRRGRRALRAVGARRHVVEDAALAQRVPQRDPRAGQERGPRGARLPGSAGAAPWIIVFTSDHGEAFGEHSAIHHGQSLYDEQIHVPGWIASGNGALRGDEVANLRAWESRPATHLDLLPTMLDALGVLDGIAMDPYRGDLAGRSLLRPYAPMAAAIPISNCTAIFPCALNVWGMMKDDHAVTARPWDSRFRCVDFTSGEDDAPMDGECARLREDSKAFFPLLPNRRPNR